MAAGQVGADFGSYCAAWEDGACKKDTCDPPWGPGHTCGTKKECKALWPSYDFDKSQTWCCDAWCYVDAATCTSEIQEKYDLAVEKSWLDVDGLLYSYEVCEDDQSFPKASPVSVYDDQNSAVTLNSYATYTAQTCPYTVPAHGCECLDPTP